MSELRQRKPVDAVPAPAPEEDDKSKTKKPATEGPNLEPSLSVMIALLVGFFSVLGLFVTYKVSNANGGEFADWVNKNFPAVESYLNVQQDHPFGFGAKAQSTDGDLRLTEAELRAYDGTDPDQAILLAINGTIYDVSASPAFYGPGGHYHHFAGRDASRAWVTECWDEPAQLTWRMDGVEAMFLPRWIDEQLEAAAAGELDPAILGELKNIPSGMITNMARKAMDKFGAPTAADKAARRLTDTVEAEKQVEAALAHWVKFFAGNAKYKTVGTVVLDDDTPAPPPPCEAALKKRPIKGGKLESMMGTIGKMMGGTGEDKQDKGPAGGKKESGDAITPEFVKEKLAKVKAAAQEALAKKEAREQEAAEQEELEHEEL